MQYFTASIAMGDASRHTARHGGRSATIGEVAAMADGTRRRCAPPAAVGRAPQSSHFTALYYKLNASLLLFPFVLAHTYIACNYPAAAKSCGLKWSRRRASSSSNSRFSPNRIENTDILPRSRSHAPSSMIRLCTYDCFSDGKIEIHSTGCACMCVWCACV